MAVQGFVEPRILSGQALIFEPRAGQCVGDADEAIEICGKSTQLHIEEVAERALRVWRVPLKTCVFQGFAEPCSSRAIGGTVRTA